jgi:hypothetical protein
MIVRTVVAQGAVVGEDVAHALALALDGRAMDRLDVAVAYATLSGLERLRTAAGGWPPVTRWVVGLDDAITEPSAIDALLALPGAEVRLASLGPARRFHPKLYRFWSSAEPTACVAAIGSANLTEHGLKRNGEAAVLLDAESAADVCQLERAWDALNGLGVPAAQADLAAYRERHARARNARRRMADRGIVPPDPEAQEDGAAFTGDIAIAAHFWIEIGAATGGRELELPKAVLAFFNLPAGAVEAHRLFILPDGSAPSLRLVDRKGNGMWRIEFTADAIRAIAGRPSFRQPDGTRRSELALHLRREGAGFRARTVPLDGEAHLSLTTRSAATGLIDSTQGSGSRAYGFF